MNRTVKKRAEKMTNSIVDTIGKVTIFIVGWFIVILTISVSINLVVSEVVKGIKQIIEFYYVQKSKFLEQNFTEEANTRLLSNTNNKDVH